MYPQQKQPPTESQDGKIMLFFSPVTFLQRVFIPCLYFRDFIKIKIEKKKQNKGKKNKFQRENLVITTDIFTVFYDDPFIFYVSIPVLWWYFHSLSIPSMMISHSLCIYPVSMMMLLVSVYSTFPPLFNIFSKNRVWSYPLYCLLILLILRIKIVQDNLRCSDPCQ